MQSPLTEARRKKYTIVLNGDELSKFDITSRPPVPGGFSERAGRILGLFAPDVMSYEIDRLKTSEPSLAEMIRTAIKFLRRNEKGFFLMVESGRIDHACHQNDAGTLLKELLAFDEALGIAYKFAKEDKKTLLIITGDHETEGVGISYCRKGQKTDYGSEENLRILEKQNSSFEKIFEEMGEKLSVELVQELVQKSLGIALSDSEAKIVVEAKPQTSFF
ncbi:MAG: alkaline phosphatase [Candidatus Edwardsbacteria bacterium]